MDYENLEELKEDRDDIAEDIDELIEEYKESEIDKPYILSKLQNTKKRLYGRRYLSDEFLDDIREIVDDLRENLEDAIEDWDEKWEEEWDDFDSEDWNETFWKTKGRHFPIRVSRAQRSLERGREGEEKVSAMLSMLTSEYHVINDVLLEYGNKSCQIDHVVVSSYGILVIETKNFAGKIYGTDEEKKWLQKIGEEQEEFYNPLMQNRNHCRAILQCIGEKYLSKMLPIVVFTSRSQLYIKSREHIVHETELLDLIGKFTAIKMSQLEVKGIVKKLEDSNNPSYEARRRHIERVKKRQ